MHVCMVPCRAFCLRRPPRCHRSRPTVCVAASSMMAVLPMLERCRPLLVSVLRYRDDVAGLLCQSMRCLQSVMSRRRQSTLGKSSLPRPPNNKTVGWPTTFWKGLWRQNVRQSHSTIAKRATNNNERDVPGSAEPELSWMSIRGGVSSGLPPKHRPPRPDLRPLRVTNHLWYGRGGNGMQACVQSPERDVDPQGYGRADVGRGPGLRD